MNESEAKAALRYMGINPTPQLIENWLRAANAEQAESELAADVETDSPPYRTNLPEQPEHSARPERHQPPSSKSRLEPILRDSGQLQRQPGPRKPGRPRIVARWFEKVAETMADGTSLKMALAMNGIRHFSKSEIRACYRNKTLQAMYTEARQKYLAEHYGHKPTLRAKFGHYL